MLDNILIDKDLRELRQAIDGAITNPPAGGDTIVFEILKDAVHTAGSAVQLNDSEKSTWTDLGLDDVAADIDGCCLQGGSRFLRDVIGRPIHDIQVLQTRRKAIHLHKALRGFWQPSNGIFDDLRALEADALWLLSLPTDEMAMAIDIVYFKTWPLRYLNGSPMCITGLNTYRSVLAPFLCIATPLIYALVAYLVVSYKFSGFGVRISPLTFARFLMSSMGAPFTNASVRCAYLGVTFVMYIQNAINTCEFARLVTRMTRHTVRRTHRALQFLDKAGVLHNRYFTPEIKAFVKSIGDVAFHSDAPPPPIKDSLSLTLACGQHLCFLKNHDRDAIVAALRATYALDMIDALARLDATKYTFAQFGGTHVPIVARRIVYPGLSNAVPNDFDGRFNHVITGPNAGGKSTFLKSIGVSLMMAQSITLVRGHSVAVRKPFRVLLTHMRVEDRVGHASLFQAEVARCRSILDKIREGGAPSLVILDELFNSTNVDDGTTAAVKFCKDVAGVPSALLVIATHYAGLAELGDSVAGRRRFALFRTQVRDDGAFTFAIEPGASTVRNGLRLAEAAMYESKSAKSSMNMASNMK